MKKQGIRGLAAGILLALSVAMTAAAGPADEIIAVEAQGQQVPQAEGVQQVQAPGSPVVDVAGPGAAAQTPAEQQAAAQACASSSSSQWLKEPQPSGFPFPCPSQQRVSG